MKILVTGGAGFIGSNLVEQLLKDESVQLVRVIDNLLTGYLSNIDHLLSHPKLEFIEADIREYEACRRAISGCTHVSHQAALGSVPRSVADPLTTNAHNVNGTLNILLAAKEEGITRVVFASSSSVYGDDLQLPKLEEKTGQVLSPYALTKTTKESYARLFSELYGLSIVGFRYFNVFGPNQSPEGPYAAVIPIFISKLYNNEQAEIHGDGSQSRDFTYIDNVISANILALKADQIPNDFQIYNIALGDSTSVKDLYYSIANLMQKDIEPNFVETRKGDIKDSMADITKITKDLNYEPLVSIQDGLRKTIDWFIEAYEK